MNISPVVKYFPNLVFYSSHLQRMGLWPQFPSAAMLVQTSSGPTAALAEGVCFEETV